MAYSLEIADAVSRTIGKFVTLNNHQLAGHLANLEFWTRQIENALDAVDGYAKRQRTLEQAQKQYIKTHETRQFSIDENEARRKYENEFGPIRAVPDRSRIDAETLATKRRNIVDSFYRFILRCFKERLLTKEEARQALDKLGIGMEPGDYS
jgi:hypothetical protein